MKLIKKLDRRLSGSKKYIVRWGLFLCPYCNKKNEKMYQNGLRNKSCGCMKNNFITTHGESHLNRSRLYYIWSSMKQRCLNKKNKAYKNYGGRGISICDEWIKSYLSFKKWALLSGYKNNLTLDRTNNNGNYEPCNCK